MPFNKKGRGQEAEGRREFCFLPTESDHSWSLRFKSPTKIERKSVSEGEDLVARNQSGSEAQTALHPSALCPLPSAFFTFKWQIISTKNF